MGVARHDEPHGLGREVDEQARRWRLLEGDPAPDDPDDGLDEAVDQWVDRGALGLPDLDVEFVDGREDELGDDLRDVRDTLLDVSVLASGPAVDDRAQPGVLLRPADVDGDRVVDDVDDRPGDVQARQDLVGQPLGRLALDRRLQLLPVGEVPVDDGATQPGALGDLRHAQLGAELPFVDELEGRVQQPGATCPVVLLPAQSTSVLGGLGAREVVLGEFGHGSRVPITNARSP